jgi:hypothetical protein
MENSIFEDQEAIRQFLVERHENLQCLDRYVVELEQHPHESTLLSIILFT